MANAPIPSAAVASARHHSKVMLTPKALRIAMPRHPSRKVVGEGHRRLCFERPLSIVIAVRRLISASVDMTVAVRAR